MEEDDMCEIIAVEKGFSTLLYESTERRYILEGTIDLVTIERSTGLTITDHKTQSRFYDKYAYNHQAMNYLSFTQADYFRYNYIGLQDKQNENTFRRPIWKCPPGMLGQWQRDVRKTFDMVHDQLIKLNWLRSDDNYISLQPEDIGAFARSRATCDGKFGICQFHKICEVPDNSKWQPIVIESAYKPKEEKWKAWS
jgi:hypothetical protein